jgi:hypothetical protein
MKSQQVPHRGYGRRLDLSKVKINHATPQKSYSLMLVRGFFIEKHIPFLNLISCETGSQVCLFLIMLRLFPLSLMI